ncbi:MAG: zinc ribbon domain-containing protein [Chloroflexota bacterium]
MDLGSLLFIVTVAVLTGWFVALPLIERRSAAISFEEHEFSTLLAERDRILGALQELDFDYSLGKIPEEGYSTTRSDLVHRGAHVLRQLDNLQGVDGTYQPADRRERKVTGEEDEIEALLAARRRSRKGEAAGFCPQCGKPVQVADRFCPGCGKKLNS